MFATPRKEMLKLSRGKPRERRNMNKRNDNRIWSSLARTKTQSNDSKRRFCEEESKRQKMQRQSSSRSVKCLPGVLLSMLCPVLLISLLSIFILSSNTPYPYFIFTANRTSISSGLIILPHAVPSQITHLQSQLGGLLAELRNESLESKAAVKFLNQVLHIAIQLDKLAVSLSSISGNVPPHSGNDMSKVEQDYSEPEEGEEDLEGSTSLKVFKSGELHNYTSPKVNRLSGKKNFLDLEAINPSVGLSCTHKATNVDRFMSYKKYRMCPDDTDLAQKLIVGGCDPLPRRRCFSKAPPHYSNPLPLNSSLWTEPSDGNILWSHYKCKAYSCLVSGKDRRGFFKCADCFNLTKRGWDAPVNESISVEFTVDEVLALKPGEIRIGLDFSPTTGTFAALMKERNVTIASATLNLGAPFNEVIALRGLLPLHLSIGSRLPFFDNTLDIVHTTLFLDGWIGMDLLQFVLFDWDRVLRPKGILWVDRFFCKKEDMQLYLDEFSRLGYKKLLWRVMPKTDKQDGELFFSAVLEKPIRR